MSSKAPESEERLYTDWLPIVKLSVHNRIGTFIAVLSLLGWRTV